MTPLRQSMACGMKPCFGIMDFFGGELWRLRRCRRGSLGRFHAGKVQEDFPLTLLEIKQPRPGHLRISHRRHGAAGLAQQSFDRCYGLLSSFQLVIASNHNTISMMPRTLPSRVVCRQSKTFSNIVAAPA